MAIPKKHLYWRARRGMLELDLMLLAYIDHVYESEDSQSQEAFVELLNFADQDLLELLMAREQADDPSIHNVIQSIRHATRAYA